MFRYSLDGIQTRVLPGEYKFVVLVGDHVTESAVMT